MTFADRELCQHAQELCQKLLRIDTTNPPGNERPAADLVAGELAAAGLDPVVLESAPGRANVVARLTAAPESRQADPLLLTAHLDVVEADASRWRHHPLSGEIADGCLWGRGAIDMKNMAAMSVAVLCRLAREGLPVGRDIIFAAVADEETGCQYGSKWLCDEHPDLVRAEYAIGEGGGFNVWLGPKMFFTIQVAEKGTCWVRARVRGEPGHGSMPREDSAVVRLAAGVARLGAPGGGLPPHMTPVVSDFLEAIAAAQPSWVRPLLGAVTATGALPRLVQLLPNKSVARGMTAMLANTASPTVLRAGDKTNVIPGVAEVEIDGRTLPGQSDEDFLAELQQLLGPEFELEVLHSAPPVQMERTPLFDTIVQVLEERAPEATAVPYLLPGFTDAKSFTQLGAKWVGFAPVKLPQGMRFADLFHGDDERIPLDGLHWGTEVLADVVTRFAAPGAVST